MFSQEYSLKFPLLLYDRSIVSVHCYHSQTVKKCLKFILQAAVLTIITIICMFGVLRRNQEFFTYKEATSLTVGGNRAVPGEKPQTIVVLLQTSG